MAYPRGEAVHARSRYQAQHFCQVTGIFKSSTEVMISVCGESPTVREVFYCGDAFATVVSVNRTGGTVDIPFTLEPETVAERQRCAGAGKRREERLEVCLQHLMEKFWCRMSICTG